MRNPLDDERPLYSEDHRLFRDSVRTFLKRHVQPYDEDWERAGIIDRGFFTAAGDSGLLLFGTPEEHGGAGTDDFRLNAILDEESARAGVASAGLSLALQNDVIGPYVLTLATAVDSEARMTTFSHLLRDARESRARFQRTPCSCARSADSSTL